MRQKYATKQRNKDPDEPGVKYMAGKLPKSWREGEAIFTLARRERSVIMCAVIEPGATKPRYEVFEAMDSHELETLPPKSLRRQCSDIVAAEIAFDELTE